MTFNACILTLSFWAGNINFAKQTKHKSSLCSQTYSCTIVIVIPLFLTCYIWPYGPLTWLHWNKLHSSSNSNPVSYQGSMLILSLRSNVHQWLVLSFYNSIFTHIEYVLETHKFTDCLRKTCLFKINWFWFLFWSKQLNLLF